MQFPLSTPSTLFVLCLLVVSCAGQCTFTVNNRITNFQFDNPSGSTTAITGWANVDNNYDIRRVGPSPGTRQDSFLALQRNDRSRRFAGAAQDVQLNQNRGATITFGAWFRSFDVKGPRGVDYSVYMDVFLSNGRTEFGSLERRNAAAAPVGTTNSNENGFVWVGGQYTPPNGASINRIRFSIFMRGNNFGSALVYRPLITEGSLNANDVLQCSGPPRGNIPIPDGSNNGGSIPPPNNGNPGTFPPPNNGGFIPPPNNGNPGTFPPPDNGGFIPPPNNGGNFPPPPNNGGNPGFPGGQSPFPGDPNNGNNGAFPPNNGGSPFPGDQNNGGFPGNNGQTPFPGDTGPFGGQEQQNGGIQGQGAAAGLAPSYLASIAASVSALVALQLVARVFPQAL